MKPALFAVASVGAVAVAGPVFADASSSPPSSEAVPTSGYVNVSVLNVRSGPKLEASVIGSLPQNATVQIQDTQGDWYGIQYNGKLAYVHKAYIATSSKKVASYTVTASALNVRSGPGTNYPVTDRLSYGASVTVQAEENGWYKILHNGSANYIKKEYVSSKTALSDPVSPLAPASYYVDCSSLRVRSGPGTGYSVVGIVQNGSQVQVTGQIGNWYRVLHNGKEAFVAKQFVKPLASSTAGQAQALFAVPAEGTVTSGFGMRWGTMHYGIDIAKTGTVPISAAAAGTVSRSYYSSSYGNVVFVKHKLAGQLYTTVYAHLNSRSVKEGDAVKQGQLLGYMGNTGHSTGQHLHFELHKGEWNLAKTNAINPIPYLQK